MNTYYLDAIKGFEGFTNVAKSDYAQFSNGYGTRARFAGEVIDRAEAEKRFQAEIAQARAIVDRTAPTADEGTKAALTSLTFNAGDAWTRSGLGAAIRAGDLSTARELFLQYNKAGGATLPGLVARRECEAQWIGQPMSLDCDTPSVTAASMAAPQDLAVRRDAVQPSLTPPSVSTVPVSMAPAAVPRAVTRSPLETLAALTGTGSPDSILRNSGGFDHILLLATAAAATPKHGHHSPDGV